MKSKAIKTKKLLFSSVFCIALLFITCTIAQNKGGFYKLSIAFLDKSHNNDSNIANTFNLWRNQLIKTYQASKFGQIEVETFVLKNYSEIEKAFANHSIDFFQIDGEDFYKLPDQPFYTPALSSEKIDNKLSRLYLLATENISLKQIADDPKLTITIPENTGKSGAKMWITNLLTDSCKLSNKRKATIIMSKSNDTKLVYSLFFGKAKYTVISERAYEIVLKLNPQISNKLKIIAVSPYFIIGSFGILRNSMDKYLYNTVISAAKNMYKDKTGKQLLDLFKTGQISEITQADIIETKKIARKYHSLNNHFVEIINEDV